MNNKKTKKIISFIGIVVFCFTFFGFFSYPEKVINSFSYIKNVISYPTKAVLAVNNVVNDFSESTSKSKPSENRENKKNNKRPFNRLLFLTLNYVLFTGETYLMFVMIVLMAFVGCVYKISGYGGSKETSKSSMRHYLLWRLLFLNPIQKSIYNRADEYDINPINKDIGQIVPNGINPHFDDKSQECGFFICKNILRKERE
ncbi:MAG: hypothetical protein ACOC5T_00650 [Elusimicrobiota bacterium]